MNNIFCILSKDVIRRNVYDTDFWTEFCAKTADVQKVLIVPSEDLERFKESFAAKDVIVEGYQKVSWHGWSKFVIFLVRTGMYSHSTKTYRWRAYAQGSAGSVATFFKELIALTLGQLTLYKQFVRTLAGRLPVSEAISDLYKKYQPIAVFAPSLIDLEFDVPVSIAARQQGIPVIGMVRSWDNLNNHGLMAFYPDTFIVQNTWLRDCAKKFQGVPERDLPTDIIGLPHYDSYKNPGSEIIDKATFFQGMGLDPNKKMILLGGSDFYYSEDTLPKKLNDAIAAGDITEPVQIVFRPHPKSLFKIEDYNLNGLEHITLNDAFSGKALFSDGDVFINLMYHADIIMNIASTLSIDAAVFNKPAMCVGFDDPEKRLTKYEEVTRLYDSFDHYEALVATGGARIATSPTEMVEQINMYLADPSVDAEGRQKIIDLFVAPFDGGSGKRLAETVAHYTTKYLK